MTSPTAAARARLRAHLQQLAASFKVENPDADLAYPGGPAQFVLEHGRWYNPQASLPLVPSLCFGNAMLLGAELGWIYVEGYALMPPGRVGRTLYVGPDINHHAWSLDAGRRPVEVTWRHPGRAYLGVSFALGRVDDAIWNGDETALDDRQRGWPLLRERWRGERWAEPLSDRLQMLAGVAEGLVERPVHAGPRAAALLNELHGRAARLGVTDADMEAAGFHGGSRPGEANVVSGYIGPPGQTFGLSPAERRAHTDVAALRFCFQVEVPVAYNVSDPDVRGIVEMSLGDDARNAEMGAAGLQIKHIIPGLS